MKLRDVIVLLIGGVIGFIGGIITCMRGSAAKQERRKPLTVDNIIFVTRGEADKVLDSMVEIAKNYGYVSVADYFDLASVDDYDLSSTIFGWDMEDVDAMKVKKVKGGYIIETPKAKKIAKEEEE